MKQSSIEWLIRELDLDNASPTMKSINQARAMHKKEITDAHTHGRNVERGIDDGIFTSEDYYNETFNTK